MLLGRKPVAVYESPKAKMVVKQGNEDQNVGLGSFWEKLVWESVKRAVATSVERLNCCIVASQSVFREYQDENGILII